jgi:hypothetical protein
VSAFDLASNTPEQRAIIEAAVAACDFDFDRILPRLLTDTGRTAVPVTWEDLTRPAAAPTDAAPITEPAARHHDDHSHGERRATLGLFYYSGRIVIERSLQQRPNLAVEVFLAEVAHAVDRYFLTAEMRRAIWAVWHPGGQTSDHDAAHGWAAPFSQWTGDMDQPGTAEVGYYESGIEAWMSGFTRSFAPDVPVTLEAPFAHRTTPEQAAQIRDIVQPEPEPEPEPEQVCASKYGYAYHRIGAHWWVICTRTYPTREAAEEAGRRACRICKP